MNKLKYLIASFITSFRDFLDDIRLVSVSRLEFQKSLRIIPKRNKKQGDY